ncbi:hypothetical protein [Enterovibrio norvegicus]|nr:hypothetical protein [Enterovibrio norvegicus]
MARKMAQRIDKFQLCWTKKREKREQRGEEEKRKNKGKERD